MKPQHRLFVNNGVAVIRCPQCRIIKKINVSRFRGAQHSFNVKCVCGHKFTVNLDFRAGIRKDTNLQGSYRHAADGGAPPSACQVVNLSYRGLRLKLQEDHTVKIGDELYVEFTLPSREQTTVSRKMVVRNLTPRNFAGGEFLAPEEDNFNTSICSFLMSKFGLR